MNVLSPPTPVKISQQAASFEFPVSIAASILCFPFFLRRLKIGRLEGFGLFFGYIGYVTYLVLDQQQSPLVAGKQELIVDAMFPVVGFLLIIYATRELISKLNAK